MGERGRQISELGASLVYRVSSRTARATQRNPVSKKKSIKVLTERRKSKDTVLKKNMEECEIEKKKLKTWQLILIQMLNRQIWLDNILRQTLQAMCNEV